MKEYYILWDYGYHKEWIETKRKDFEKTLFSMSTEFEIYKEKKEADVKTMKGRKIKKRWTNYYIYNYLGDKYIFASISL